MNENEAYNLGWSAGYKDEYPECPYSDDSIEGKDWWNGYRDGSRES